SFLLSSTRRHTRCSRDWSSDVCSSDLRDFPNEALMDLLFTLLATVVALGLLVTIHEYGHFWVARRCGVKVLRFSIGFGPALYSWHDRHGTEFVIAGIPLGGYVKMLDEREAPGRARPDARGSRRPPSAPPLPPPLSRRRPGAAPRPRRGPHLPRGRRRPPRAPGSAGPRAPGRPDRRPLPCAGGRAPARRN